MRRNSLLHDVIVCATAAGPLRAISGDTMLWRAWIDFATFNWIKYYADAYATKVILPCAFVCLSMHAQAQAALTSLREGGLG